MRNFVLAVLFALLSTGVAGQDVIDFEGSFFDPDSGIDEGIVAEMFECPSQESTACAAFAVFTFNSETGAPVWMTSSVFVPERGQQVVSFKQPNMVGDFETFPALVEIQTETVLPSPVQCQPFLEGFITWPVTEEGQPLEESQTMVFDRQVGGLIPFGSCVGGTAF